MRPVVERRSRNRCWVIRSGRRDGVDQIEIDGGDITRKLFGQLIEVDSPHLDERFVGGIRIGQFAALAFLGNPNAGEDLCLGRGSSGRVETEWHEPSVDHDRDAAVGDEAGQHVVASEAVLRTIEPENLIGQVAARNERLAPLDRGQVVAGLGEQVFEGNRGFVDLCGHELVELFAFIETVELPEREPDHQHDRPENEDVERDPLRTQQEGEVRPGHLGHDGSGRRALPCRAMRAEDLTADWLSSTLGGDVGPVSSQLIGDGHIGVNARISMPQAEAGLPRSVVVKLPATDEISLATAAMLRHYERETKFYTELASTVDMRVPACLHGEWDAATNAFVLVLEDMAPATQGDQLTGCSLEQARDAVRELAKLHGPRWDDPTLYDIDWIEHDKGDQGDDAANSLAVMWQMFFPGFSETYRSHLSDDEFELAERFGGAIAQWRGGRTGPKTITHGDYRLDNMLFATAEGGPPVSVVDWQTPAHGSPITDLSYFIGAGLLPDDRRTHERDLVAIYIDALGAYGVSLDAAWVWEHYRRDAFAGLAVAAMASQIVTLNDRSEAMFGAMAQRHLRQAIDLDSFSLI